MGKSRKVKRGFTKNHVNKRKMRKLIDKNTTLINKIKEDLMVSV